MLTGLGAQWDDRLLQSWQWVFGVLSAAMQSGADSGGLDDANKVALVQTSWAKVGKLDPATVADMFYTRVPRTTPCAHMHTRECSHTRVLTPLRPRPRVCGKLRTGNSVLVWCDM